MQGAYHQIQVVTAEDKSATVVQAICSFEKDVANTTFSFQWYKVDFIKIRIGIYKMLKIMGWYFFKIGRDKYWTKCQKMCQEIHVYQMLVV